MNKENRFDHIVGLIYDAAHDTAHDSTGNDAVLQAIRAELGNPDEPHENADSLMRRLTPHLARSDSLRGRIRQLQMQHFIQQVELTNLPFSLVWVGADLRVVTQNARAESLLSTGCGICVCDNRLTAWVATDMERLDLALHNALRAKDRKGILLALRQRDQPVPLLASVIPVTAPPAGGQSAGGCDDRFALIILQNPNEAAIGLAHLQCVYGFTAAECKLAEALLGNDTLECYAVRAAVSRSTLRSHLARLFKKTGTCRQSELVRLLLLAQIRA